MDIFKGLIGLSEDRIITYTLLIFSLFFPGGGYLYLVKPEMFHSLDIFKLIFLAIFYSVPLFLIGMIYTSFNSREIGLHRSPSNSLDGLLSVSFFSLSCFFMALLFFGIPTKFQFESTFLHFSFLEFIYFWSAVYFWILFFYYKSGGR